MVVWGMRLGLGVVGLQEQNRDHLIWLAAVSPVVKGGVLVSGIR